MAEKDKKDDKDKDERETTPKGLRVPPRSRPRDDVDRLIKGTGNVLSLDERVETIERAILKPMKKRWGHPISVFVSGRYHQCAACGNPVGNEVVVVVERLRRGDRITVFCDKICLVNHSEW